MQIRKTVIDLHSMELKVKNLMTISQVSNLCGYYEGAVRHALSRGVITSIRPFPNKLGSDEDGGPIMIVCDSKLLNYMERAKFNARERFCNITYDPVFEASRYVDWV